MTAYSPGPVNVMAYVTVRVITRNDRLLTFTPDSDFVNDIVGHRTSERLRGGQFSIAGLREENT